MLKDITIQKIGEMDSIAKGIIFMTNHTVEDYYSYSTNFKSIVHSDIVKKTYPKLIVNVGSGVSLLKINDFDNYERITGTMISGNTLHSLWWLVYGRKISYTEMLALIENGDHHNVDTTVGDIYGNSSNFSIPKDTVASSLGKLFKSNSDSFKSTENTQDLGKSNLKISNKEDILQSIAFLISANLSHIAVLTAQLHGINQIWYTGGFSQVGRKNSNQKSDIEFMNGHEPHNFIMDSLDYGVNFHSNNTLKCCFIRNWGFAGVIGALIS